MAEVWNPMTKSFSSKEELERMQEEQERAEFEARRSAERERQVSDEVIRELGRRTLESLSDEEYNDLLDRVNSGDFTAQQELEAMQKAALESKKSEPILGGEQMRQNGNKLKVSVQEARTAAEEAKAHFESAQEHAQAAQEILNGGAEPAVEPVIEPVVESTVEPAVEAESATELQNPVDIKNDFSEVPIEDFDIESLGEKIIEQTKIAEKAYEEATGEKVSPERVAKVKSWAERHPKLAKAIATVAIVSAVAITLFTSTNVRNLFSHNQEATETIQEEAHIENEQDDKAAYEALEKLGEEYTAKAYSIDEATGNRVDFEENMFRGLDQNSAGFYTEVAEKGEALTADKKEGRFSYDHPAVAAEINGGTVSEMEQEWPKGYMDILSGNMQALAIEAAGRGVTIDGMSDEISPSAINKNIAFLEKATPEQRQELLNKVAERAKKMFDGGEVRADDFEAGRHYTTGTLAETANGVRYVVQADCVHDESFKVYRVFKDGKNIFDTGKRKLNVLKAAGLLSADAELGSDEAKAAFEKYTVEGYRAKCGDQWVITENKKETPPPAKEKDEPESDKDDDQPVPGVSEADPTPEKDEDEDEDEDEDKDKDEDNGGGGGNDDDDGGGGGGDPTPGPDKPKGNDPKGPDTHAGDEVKIPDTPQPEAGRNVVEGDGIGNTGELDRNPGEQIDDADKDANAEVNSEKIAEDQETSTEENTQTKFSEDTSGRKEGQVNAVTGEIEQPTSTAEPNLANQGSANDQTIAQIIAGDTGKTQEEVGQAGANAFAGIMNEINGGNQ